MHRDEVKKINPSLVSEELLSGAASSWDQAVELADLHGVRNSQATLLAPTGTIAFFMDCDTTGIEPDLGLVKVKKLVGGGTMSIVNQTVPRALKALGYKKTQIDDIINYIDVEKTIIGAPHLKAEHLNVFACSMGDNAISYQGHVKMMAAVQPFLSGAISKTVNLPEEVTIEDVEQLHIDAWEMGLKAVAIYRDNAKVAQPLAMAKKEGAEDSVAAVLTAHQAVSETIAEAVNDRIVVRGVVRHELPKVRNAKTFKFYVADSKGFMTVGEYDDGTPGELFVQVSKQGSTLRGIMDSFGIAVSYGLQYGVPLKDFVGVFTNTNFAPSGVTDDPEIRTASSLMDYIFRRLALTYLSFDDRLEVGLAHIDDTPVGQTSLLATNDVVEIKAETANTGADETVAAAAEPTPSLTSAAVKVPAASKKPKHNDSPVCFNCGNQTQRAGNCFVCTSCGSTTGCS